MKTDHHNEKSETIEIKLRHLENDFILTKGDYEKTKEKYLEILSELREKNEKLKTFQEELEKRVEYRTKELKELYGTYQAKSMDLQIILDSSPMMIYYKDKEYRYNRVNKAFAEFIGLNIKEIVGKKDYEIFPDRTEHHLQEDREVLEFGKSQTGLIEQRESFRGKRWIQLDKVPYRDMNENVIGIIGFAIDITDRVQAEKGKREIEEQLFQVQKMESINDRNDEKKNEIEFFFFKKNQESKNQALNKKRNPPYHNPNKRRALFVVCSPKASSETEWSVAACSAVSII